MEKIDITKINKKRINKDNFKELLDGAYDFIQSAEQIAKETLSIKIYKYIENPNFLDLQEIVSMVVFLKTLKNDLSTELQNPFRSGVIEWDKSLDEYIK